MPNEVTSINRSAATTAGKSGATGSAPAAGNEGPSARIRHVCDLVREILLRDHYGLDPVFGPVRDELEEMQVELSDLVGQQMMFESWVGSAP